jgi:hypothetical protein
MKKNTGRKKTTETGRKCRDRKINTETERKPPKFT